LRKKGIQAKLGIKNQVKIKIRTYESFFKIDWSWYISTNARNIVEVTMSFQVTVSWLRPKII